MKIKPDFLKQTIFSDQPANWLINSQGFFYAVRTLIEAEKNKISGKFVSTEAIFNKQFAYKVGIYLLSHAIELLLKAAICAYNKTNPSDPLKEPMEYGRNAKEMFDKLVSKGIIFKEDSDNEVIELVNIYLQWQGRYFRIFATSLRALSKPIRLIFLH